MADLRCETQATVARRMRADVWKGVRSTTYCEGVPLACVGRLPTCKGPDFRLNCCVFERQASSSWEPYDVEELRGKTMGIIG